LPAISNNGIVGSWDPAINNNTTTTYTFTPDPTMGNCVLPVTMTVEVHDINADAGVDNIVTAYVPYQLQGSGGAANLQYTWVPSFALNNPTVPNPIAVLNSDTKFYLTVSDGSGCKGYDSVMIRVYRDSGFYVPSAFTPNGDGLNDVVKVIPVSISKIEYFRIFNRYGNLVFETSDISKGWDGNYKNKKQDTGSYIFIVKGISITGTPVVRKGTLLLIN
jgi:gliding motility-associated-like protein